MIIRSSGGNSIKPFGLGWINKSLDPSQHFTTFLYYINLSMGVARIFFGGGDTFRKFFKKFLKKIAKNALF